jgi:hypothetical protein
MRQNRLYYGHEQLNHGRGICRFVKSPTKAHLLAIGDPAPGAYFADIEAHISFMYKAAAKRRLGDGTEVAEPIDFRQLWRSPDHATITRDVDCETVAYDLTLPPHRPGRRQSQEASSSSPFYARPILALGQTKPFR